MNVLEKTLPMILEAPPSVLLPLVALSAIFLAAFAIHVVHSTVAKKDKEDR